MVTVDDLLDRDTTQQEKVKSSDAAIGGIALGVTLVAAGGWLV